MSNLSHHTVDHMHQSVACVLFTNGSNNDCRANQEISPSYLHTSYFHMFCSTWIQWLSTSAAITSLKASSTAALVLGFAVSLRTSTSRSSNSIFESNGFYGPMAKVKSSELEKKGRRVAFLFQPTLSSVVSWHVVVNSSNVKLKVDLRRTQAIDWQLFREIMHLGILTIWSLLGCLPCPVGR